MNEKITVTCTDERIQRIKVAEDKIKTTGKMVVF